MKVSGLDPLQSLCEWLFLHNKRYAACPSSHARPGLLGFSMLPDGWGHCSTRNVGMLAAHHRAGQRGWERWLEHVARALGRWQWAGLMLSSQQFDVFCHSGPSVKLKVLFMLGVLCCVCALSCAV